MLLVENESRNPVAETIKQQRISLSLTLQNVSDKSGVSASHLARIERGERFPSGYVLQRIAEPLSFTEDEIFTLAGYLTPKASTVEAAYPERRLDPLVARLLAEEPVEVQRLVIAIATVMRSVAREMVKER